MQLPILLAEAAELLAFLRCQARPSLRPIGAGVIDPVAERRLCQIQVPSHPAYALPLVSHKPHRGCRPLTGLLRATTWERG